MKLVISTHPSYTHALSLLLDSLTIESHLDDTIVVISDVPAEATEATTEHYKSIFGLRHVLCHHSNNYEFTAMYTIGKHLKAIEESKQTRLQVLDDIHFVFLHDTTQVDPRFWQDIQIMCQQAEAAPECLWHPFCDNFNMGIATRDFLKNIVFPAFAGIRLTKQACINAELLKSHPLNLTKLAGAGKWRYANGGEIVLLKAQRPWPWKNDTFVYDEENTPRSVVRLEVPLLYKFVRLRNEENKQSNPPLYKWDPKACMSYPLQDSTH